MVTEIKFRAGIQGRNPDVLTCIANLSNDEIFTPPPLANQMLDLLEENWSLLNNGESIWTRSDLKYFDPFSKSGIFLREIVTRLNKGLSHEIPDLNTRIDHILTKQIFGFAITNLTSLMSRRSLYCSKYANGGHSVAKSFKNEQGNIWFENTPHEWIAGRTLIEKADKDGNPEEVMVGGVCKFCGAKQESFDRGPNRELHAYKFIHTNNIHSTVEEIFGEKMQFDVIIGNPPYQLNDGGGSGTSAAPIYQKFVEQAKKLEPRSIVMVIQSRWFSGGKGLDDFREKMLKDNRIRSLVDFPDSNDVFPGTQIKGGICYFLWDRDNPGDCTVVNMDNGEQKSKSTRPLLEPGLDVFIRYNAALPVIRKVVVQETGKVNPDLLLPYEKSFSSLVSARRPFGEIESKMKSSKSGDVKVYKVGGFEFVKKAQITTGSEYVGKWKVFIPFLASGSDSFPHPILGKPFIGEPDSATTETNLVIGPFKSKKEASNAISYISTKFFRFLVLQRKPSQNATRKVYGFVPIQDFSKPWTDTELFEKYKISSDQIAFIDSLIRPMEL
jgi:hypothetical protein